MDITSEWFKQQKEINTQNKNCKKSGIQTPNPGNPSCIISYMQQQELINKNSKGAFGKQLAQQTDKYRAENIQSHYFK